MPHITPNLELQEDKMFSELADQRIATTKKWVSHKDAWKNVRKWPDTILQFDGIKEFSDIKELRKNKSQ